MVQVLSHIQSQLAAMSLREKVAQRFMLGYSGKEPNPITQRFIQTGLGGIIFFRDNFDSLTPQNAETAQAMIAQLQESRPTHLPPLLMGIDQEGGQVERVPHTMMSTALTPMAVALSPQPEALAQHMYTAMAQQLVGLGINLNFAPTLDVNFQPANPIIGVRSFGKNANSVWKLAKVLMESFEDAGLIAVGKHFPGHGNGTVDSHLDLPVLNYTDEEFSTFQAAIQAGIPAILVAHGFYPALQTTPEEQGCPSSASRRIIQQLLREQCNFDGVIITDDMCMGAITKHQTPIQAAMASLQAGVDILLYKQSIQAEWEVFEAVVAAFETGHLSIEQLDASVARILRMKAQYLEHKQVIPIPSPQERTEQAFQIALKGMGVRQGDKQLLPLAAQMPFLLVHPDRQALGNYAFDVPTSPNLDKLLSQTNLNHYQQIEYPHQQASGKLLGQLPANFTPKAIVFISFNPLIHRGQAELYEALKSTFPQAKMILASAGTPYDLQLLSQPDLHLSLCSYRPATMQALAKVLQAGLV